MTFIHQYLIKILAVSAGAHTHTRMLSCFVGHTSTNLITEVMQRWARLVLGWLTSQMTSMSGIV
jgi:hypothetical protein